MVIGGILKPEIEDETEDEKKIRIAGDMCEFAVLVNAATQKINMDDDWPLKIRIGVHHGPAVAGLSGTVTPRYCSKYPSPPPTSRNMQTCSHSL